MKKTMCRADDECSELSRLVVTTGGTGISPRDVTPEATRSVVEKLIEGIPEHIRAEGGKRTPFAALTRGLCGIRGKSLILNLPGSPKGATESLQSVISLLSHMIDFWMARPDIRAFLSAVAYGARPVAMTRLKVPR